MAGLKIDNLSDSLLNYLEGLGLSEEQVQQLIDNISGDLSALQTTDKSSLVAAINELFQNANNGKELIATAIGEPLTAEDTFNAMSNDINGLLSRFKTNMMNNGVSVSGTDKFKALIDKLATLADNEGKGIQYAEGSGKQISVNTMQNDGIVVDINFEPTLLFLVLSNRNTPSYTSSEYHGGTGIVGVAAIHDLTETNSSCTIGLGANTNGPSSSYYYDIVFNTGLTDGKITVKTIRVGNSWIYGYPTVDYDWYAFGVGEEDTTLRDSLASILQEEGVIVAPEDEMANLITKTDEEFDRKNNKAENTRNKLAGLMKDGGYEITGEEDIDRLLELLTISGINLDEIKQISCGGHHTFILKTDGSIWSCGFNNYGQLGLGTSDNNAHSTFTQVTNNINNDVKQIACGDQHTFILKNDGSIWSCGYNSVGQLGLGTSDNNAHSTFTQVTNNINNDVKQIACGFDYTFILKTDGSIWSCGSNNHGQLGLGDTTNRNTFTKVTNNINNDVKQVACGYYHTFILKNDGSIWSCGYNNYGQLGLGYNTDIFTFTKVTTNINNDVSRIVCGFDHTFILKNDGSIWSCGYNNSGELGLGTADTNAHSTLTQIPRGLY